MISGYASPSTAQLAVFADDFSDGELSEYVVTDGSSSDWQIDSKIDGNSLYGGREDGQATIVLDPDTHQWRGNMNIEVNFRVDTSNWKRNAFVWFYDGDDRWSGSVHLQGNSLKINYDANANGNIDHGRSELDIAVDASETHHLLVEIRGDTITVTLDGDSNKQIRHTHTSPIGPGTVGVGNAGGVSHATWFDNLRVTRYGAEPTDEEATETPVTATSSPVPFGVPDADELRQGTETEVRTLSPFAQPSPGVEGGPYYVIRHIPSLEDHRRAVVTPDYEYVSLWETMDALWVENYVNFQDTDAVIDHHERKVERSRERRETYNNRNTLSRFSEMLINGAQLITLVKTGGAEEGISTAFDAFTDLVAWTKSEMENDPYKQKFTALAQSLEAAAWAENKPDSTLEFDEEIEEFFDTSMEFYFDYYMSAEEAYAAWGDYTAGSSRFADLWRVDIDPDDIEPSDVKKRIFVRLAIFGLDNYVEDYFRAEARHAAMMSSLHTVRLNLLDKIINILKDIREGAVSPGQLLQYHVYRFVLYQMTALGNEYAGEVLGGLSGPMVWIKSASPTIESPHVRAEKHRRWAEENKRLASVAFGEVGAARSDIGRRHEQSVNAMLYDTGGDSR